MQHDPRKHTILCVVNKRLPAGDYRLAHPQLSKRFHVVFALPEPPDELPASDYVAFYFGEGMKPRYLREFWRLYRYLRRYRSEIGLVHFYSTNLVLVGPTIARMAGVPSVTTLTGFGRVFSSQSRAFRSLQGVYWLLLGFSLRVSRRLLLQNHGDLKRLKRKFPEQSNRLVYAGSAVSMNIFENKEFNEQPLIVTHIARIMDDKGILDFLGVARELSNEPVRFQLVGPPSIGFEGLLEEVTKAADEGLIEYLGELDSTAIQSHLEKAHILFFPSHGEGLPRVMLEAGFNGVYPIAYDISANLDLVISGGGTLLAKGDVSAATDEIRQLVNDRAKLATGAKVFQDHITRAYGIQAFSDRMDGIYAEVFSELERR